MICSYCNKVALYREGSRGFCSDHRQQAVVFSKSLDMLRVAKRAIADRKVPDMTAGGGSTRPRTLRERGLKPYPNLHMPKYDHDRVVRAQVTARNNQSHRGGKRIYDPETEPLPNVVRLSRGPRGERKS